jgi:hypothetical protein
MKIGNWKLEKDTASRSDNAAEMVALLDVMEELRQQNRELHDRVLALTRPEALEQVGRLRLAEMELTQPVRSSTGAMAVVPDVPGELVGTQVGEPAQHGLGDE